MYIKWIVCEVPTKHKKQFSIAQEKWIKTKEAKGFIAQTGGWNLLNPKEACIISFWKDKESLTNFMNNLHDDIFFQNQQSATYTSITVSYYNSLLTMEGSENSIPKAIKKGQLLRIADCEVKQNKKTHFIEVQKSIWLPTMKKSEGMLGGKFAVKVTNSLNYLVSTFWDSESNHKKYLQMQLPMNQKAANINDDLKSIQGKLVLLEKSWKIIPT